MSGSIKNTRMRPMDQKAAAQGPQVGGTAAGGYGTFATPVPVAAIATPPPIIGAPDAPTNVIIGTIVPVSSLSTPQALVPIMWDSTESGAVFLVRIGTLSDFSNARIVRAETPSVVVQVAAPVTITVNYYVQVCTLVGNLQSAWSDVATATIAPDTTPPPPMLAAAASFDTASGTLNITYTPPVVNFYRDAQITIWSSSAKTLMLFQDFTMLATFGWTAAQNLAAGGGVAADSVFVEVCARSYTGGISTPISATASLPRPATPTGAGGVWNGMTGVCVFSCDAVPGAARYDWTIDAKARSTTNITYSYTLDLNRLEHSGTPDPVLTWSLVAVNALGKPSQTAATGTATLPKPSTPNMTTQLFTSPDAVFGWTALLVAQYRLTIDGLARLVATAEYTYTFARNAQEHSGTASPALAWGLVAIDALGQESDPVVGTLTNTPPTAPSQVTALAGPSSALISVTATKPADFLAVEYRIIQAGATVKTYRSTNLIDNYLFPASGMYQIGAKIVDVFEQASAETTLAAAIQADVFDMVASRSETTYSDDLGTASATLDLLKDNNASASGVPYSAI